MAININRVVLTGNLTADPELRSLPSGTSICKLRLACNTRKKDGASGEWVDKPNYFDVTVWGASGENAARYLSKGRPVAIDGRLEWREWQTEQGGKRQAVEIVADVVQFLGGNPNAQGSSPDTNANGTTAPVAGDIPVDGDYAPAGGGGGAPVDDDIPFKSPFSSDPERIVGEWEHTKGTRRQ